MALLIESYWPILASFAIAAVVTFLASYPARVFGYRRKIMDHPVDRSSHTVAVPRTGGIAIIVGILAAVAIFSRGTFPLAVGLASVAAIAAVSLVDDLVTISSVLRLVVHLAVTGVTVWVMGVQLTELRLPYYCLPLPYWAGMGAAVLFVAGFVNFFNFMDGINGISVAQGLIGGVAIAGLLLHGRCDNSVVVAAALAGACVGFGPHNFPSAKMFMGDSGSTVLGYVLAMLTLIGAARTSIPWIAFVLPLGVFVYDTVFTLVKRIARRENPVKAHREHHYQLLIRSGWSHAAVTLLQAGLMLLCTGAAVAYALGGDAVRLAVLCAMSIVAAGYSVSVHRHFATRGTDEPAGSQ